MIFLKCNIGLCNFECFYMSIIIKILLKINDFKVFCRLCVLILFCFLRVILFVWDLCIDWKDGVEFELDLVIKGKKDLEIGFWIFVLRKCVVLFVI